MLITGNCSCTVCLLLFITYRRAFFAICTRMCARTLGYFAYKAQLLLLLSCRDKRRVSSGHCSCHFCGPTAFHARSPKQPKSWIFFNIHHVLLIIHTAAVHILATEPMYLYTHIFSCSNISTAKRAIVPIKWYEIKNSRDYLQSEEITKRRPLAGLIILILIFTYIQLWAYAHTYVYIQYICCRQHCYSFYIHQVFVLCCLFSNKKSICVNICVWRENARFFFIAIKNLLL